MDRVITRENKMTHPTQADALNELRSNIYTLCSETNGRLNEIAMIALDQIDCLRRAYIEGKADALKEE